MRIVAARGRQGRDRATKLLNFLGNVIVNGNPHAKGYRPEKPFTARFRCVQSR